MKLKDNAEAEFTDDERAEAAIELAYLGEERIPQALEGRIWGDAQAFLGAQKNGRNIASTTASTTLLIEESPARIAKQSSTWSTYGFAAAAAALLALGGARFLHSNSVHVNGSQNGTSDVKFVSADKSLELSLTSETLTVEPSDASVCRSGCEVGSIEGGRFVKLALLPAGSKSVTLNAPAASTLRMRSQALVIRAFGSTSDIALERR
jgi:hypothetical protein